MLCIMYPGGMCTTHVRVIRSMRRRKKRRKRPAKEEDEDKEGTKSATAPGEEPVGNTLQRQRDDVRFRVGVTCVSLIRYLAENITKVPLMVMTRLLETHDIMVSLVPLIENPPWTRRKDDVRALLRGRENPWLIFLPPVFPAWIGLWTSTPFSVVCRGRGKSTSTISGAKWSRRICSNSLEPRRRSGLRCTHSWCVKGILFPFYFLLFLSVGGNASRCR